jgi:hypothetical protein
MGVMRRVLAVVTIGVASVTVSAIARADSVETPTDPWTTGKVERLTLSEGQILRDEVVPLGAEPTSPPEPMSTTTCTASGGISTPPGGRIHGSAGIFCSRPSIAGARLFLQRYSPQDRAWLTVVTSRNVNQPTPPTISVSASAPCGFGTQWRVHLKWNAVTPDGATGDHYTDTAPAFCQP